MIHYHGLPITPDHVAAQILTNAHALISFANPEQIGLVSKVCSSFVVDNGAFSAWKSGNPIVDWSPYLDFSLKAISQPNCDWVIIPDVIDGDEKQNDSLIDWFIGKWSCYRGSSYSCCVPVWHLHESFSRLKMLAELFPRIAFGSSGKYSNPKSPQWWQRIIEAFKNISFQDGSLYCKVHGLRMLDPKIFTKLPLSSADSSTIARTVGIDKKWGGPYSPPTKSARGILMRQRIENNQSSDKIPNIEFLKQEEFF